MIKKIGIWLLLATTLMACGLSSGGGGGDEVPTLAPTAAVGGETDGSPRVTVEPENQLPPTWTPEPAPEQPTPLPPPSTPETYTIQAGDTLAEIAIAFGVELQTLVDANDIANIDIIEVGDTLIIPR